MIASEDEAKAKWWCPQTFGAMPVYDEYERPLRDEGPYRCLGSGCAAWRWAMEDDGETPLYQSVRIRNAPNHTINEPVGYCGMAGKP